MSAQRQQTAEPHKYRKGARMIDRRTGREVTIERAIPQARPGSEPPYYSVKQIVPYGAVIYWAREDRLEPVAAQAAR